MGPLAELEGISVVSGDFFHGLTADEQRETTINWPGLVQRVIDDYRQHTTLAHGVQKDAIQNAWDARRSRRHATGWSCTFDLFLGSEGASFLAITDRGTWGLTGRVLSADEYYEDLPELERWARFESLAFTHPEGAAEGQLGARGQGKFIFVGASAEQRMLYDTLREDGVYRLGVRTVEPTRSPVYVWDGEAAINRLKAYHNSLEPLQEIGTRVIIDSPTDELTNAIVSGAFARHIAETWWPIILKHGAEISVRVTTEGVPPDVVTVGVPTEIELPDAENSRYDVWLKKNHRIDYQGDSFVVKRLHVVRDRRGVADEDMRGVALIRGGMKVMSLPMRHVPSEIGDAVVGFVEFDRALDDEMKRLESPTHYSFDLGRGLGRKLKNYVEDELSAFAREKLGQGADPRAVNAERHREAERRALAAINRAARSMGIIGRHGPGGGTPPRTNPSVDQPLAAVLIPPVFPSGTRRLNFGDSAEASAFIRSRLDAPALVRASLYLTHGDETILRFDEMDLALEAGGESSLVGPLRLAFEPDVHGPGEYTVRAKAVLLQETSGLMKGHEHKTAYRFWLEQDPPEVGIFDEVEGLNYQEIPIDAEVVRSSSGGWKFQYNTSHPAKRREDQTEDSLFDYLLRLMARELVFVDLRSGEPTQFTADDLESPDETYRKAAMITSRILYEYYG